MLCIIFNNSPHTSNILRALYEYSSHKHFCASQVANYTPQKCLPYWANWHSVPESWNIFISSSDRQEAECLYTFNQTIKRVFICLIIIKAIVSMSENS